MYVFYVERSGLTDAQLNELSNLPISDSLENAIANCRRLEVPARLADPNGSPIGAIDSSGVVTHRRFD